MLVVKQALSTDFMASSNWRLKAFIRYMSDGFRKDAFALAGLAGLT
jgi:hypothetical protein